MNAALIDRQAARLEAKVRARNRLNALIKEQTPRITQALAPMVGRKIRTQDGHLTAAAAAHLPTDLPCNTHNRILVRSDKYTLYLDMQTTEDVNEGTFSVSQYQKEQVMLGDVQDGKLVKFYEFRPQDYPETHSAAGVTKTRKDLADARQAVRDLERLLSNFGEFDT